ncbi:MAG: molybdopterin-guanine dinucleotide biosynthesis protein B [Thermoproteus sp.]
MIQITGNKDVGKTVLAERLISLASARGLKVFAVKQSHHIPDIPDKDSYRMKSAGADVVALRGGGMWAFFSNRFMLSELNVDIVIIEGFRDAKLGFKVHIGPDPPADADLVFDLDEALASSEEILKLAKCDVDILEFLSKF